MKKLFSSYIGFLLAFFLCGCATTTPESVGKKELHQITPEYEGEKELGSICKKYDYINLESLNDSRRDVSELWRKFDKYYNASRAPKGRKLAVFLDGTSNDADKPTNVWKLYHLAVAQACEGNPVIPYYDKGVGSKWWNPEDILFGNLLGDGVGKNIKQAYEFLSQTYSKNNNDKIYIFGFSRGAFTARSLNGLIEFAGLLDWTNKPENSHFKDVVDNVYDQYHVKNDDAAAVLKKQIRDYELKKYPEYTFKNVKVQAIGVFDTVPALGFKEDPKNHKLQLYANKGFHALALDEHRKPFELNRFNKKDINKENQVLHEVWFAGGHSNIGGGYSSTMGCNIINKDGLEATPLNWMIAQFKDEHLFPDTPPFPECIDGELHDAFYPLYRIVGELQRKPEENDVIHESVLQRMKIEKLDFPHYKRESGGRYVPLPMLPKNYTIESTK
ncbi:MAG: DUF2235 domain-containing protein [Methylococcales bacterium]